MPDALPKCQDVEAVTTMTTDGYEACCAGGCTWTGLRPIIWPVRRTMQSRLAVALAAIAATGCASTGAVPRPFPVPGGSQVSTGSIGSTGAAGSEGPTSFDTQAIVEKALSLRGAPYRNGGVDPNGFDCSGFTQYVYAQYGVGLPREVRDQFQAGVPVKPRELQAGDLLFFSTTAPGASHVGIAIGGDRFVHAPSSAGVVRVERMSAAYWSRRWLGARRVG